MNRLILSVLFVTLCVPALVLAQAPAGAPAAQAAPAVITPAKIAWMNLEQVIFTCDEGKNKFLEVQKFVDDKNTELDTLRKDMEKLRNQLSVQGSKLTD